MAWPNPWEDPVMMQTFGSMVANPWASWAILSSSETERWVEDLILLASMGTKAVVVDVTAAIVKRMALMKIMF